MAQHTKYVIVSCSRMRIAPLSVCDTRASECQQHMRGTRTGARSVRAPSYDLGTKECVDGEYQRDFR